jgi:hypothetical protein
MRNAAAGGHIVRRRYVKMPAYNPKTGLYHGRGGSSDGFRPPRGKAPGVPVRRDDPAGGGTGSHGLRPPRGKAADVPVRKVEPEGKE